METVVLTKKQNQELLNQELFKYEIAIITIDKLNNPDIGVYGALLSLNYNIIEARNKYIHDYGNIEDDFIINEDSLLIININNDTKFLNNLEKITNLFYDNKFVIKNKESNVCNIIIINHTKDHIHKTFSSPYEWKPSFVNREIPKVNVVKVVDFVSLLDNIKTRNVTTKGHLSYVRNRIFGF